MTEHDDVGLSMGEHPKLYLPNHPNETEPSPDDFYSWARLVYSLDTRREAIEATEKAGAGDIVNIDLGSSVPIYTEMLRKRHLRTTYWYARQAIVDFKQTINIASGNDERPKNQKRFGAFLQLSTYQRKHFTQWFLDEGSEPYNLLCSSLSDLCYNNTLTADNTEDLAGKLYEDLLERKDYVRYEKPENPQEMDQEHRWQIKATHSKTQKSLLEMLVEYEIGDEVVHLDEDGHFISKDVSPPVSVLDTEQAQKLLLQFSNVFLGDRLVTPRRHFAFSFDLAHPDILRQGAEGAFRDDIKKLDFYRDALRLSDHARVDVHHLPLAQPESVTMYTSFESWPYHTAPEENLEIGSRLYNQRRDEMKELAFWVYYTLQQGGVFLCFPWATKTDTPANQGLLDDVLDYFKYLGADVDLDIKSGEELKHWMTQTEKALMLRSPVFKNDEPRTRYTMLRVTKRPFERLPWVPPNRLEAEHQLHLGHAALVSSGVFT